MKKLVLLLGIILYLVSCKVEEPKFANQSTFLEAETTTIEHVSIPLTNSQLLELFRNMSPLAQTRVAVFNLLTEGEVEFWSTEGPGVLVMYFTAPWNGPCKRYRLIFEKVANDYTYNLSIKNDFESKSIKYISILLASPSLKRTPI